jgi:hypothetical protein
VLGQESTFGRNVPALQRPPWLAHLPYTIGLVGVGAFVVGFYVLIFDWRIRYETWIWNLPSCYMHSYSDCLYGIKSSSAFRNAHFSPNDSTHTLVDCAL